MKWLRTSLEEIMWIYLGGCTNIMGKGIVNLIQLEMIHFYLFPNDLYLRYVQ